MSKKKHVYMSPARRKLKSHHGCTPKNAHAQSRVPWATCRSCHRHWAHTQCWGFGQEQGAPLWSCGQLQLLAALAAKLLASRCWCLCTRLVKMAPGYRSTRVMRPGGQPVAGYSSTAMTNWPVTSTRNGTSCWMVGRCRTLQPKSMIACMLGAPSSSLIKLVRMISGVPPMPIGTESLTVETFGGPGPKQYCSHSGSCKGNNQPLALELGQDVLHGVVAAAVFFFKLAMMASKSALVTDGSRTVVRVDRWPDSWPSPAS